jgi:hypothetical protein
VSVDRAGVIVDLGGRGHDDEGSRVRQAGWLALAVVAIVVATLVGSASARAADCSLPDYGYNGACGPEYESPAWGDGSGWNRPSKYSTIQLADITGNGTDELIGRNDNGLEIWTFDTTIGQWRPAIGANGRPEVLTDFRSPLPSEAPDTHGANPMVYQTIQTGEVVGDGTRSIIAQFPDGVHTYDYTPPSGTRSINGGSWHEEPVGGPTGGQPSQYLALHIVGTSASVNGPGNVPATLVDQDSYWIHQASGGWAPASDTTSAPFSQDPGYYLDNQVGMMPRQRNGAVELAPVNVWRTADGVGVQAYDQFQGGCLPGTPCFQWLGLSILPTSGLGCQATGRCSPFTDNPSPNCVPQEFNCFGTLASWYETMRVANDLQGPGDPEGYVLGRLVDGLHAYGLRSEGGWDSSIPVLSALKDPPNSSPPPGEWSSIRTGDVTGDGFTDVLALSDGQLRAWALNPGGSGPQWSELGANSALNLGGSSWESNAAYYSTIEVGPVARGYPDAVIARGPFGIRTWFFCTGGQEAAVPGCDSLQGKTGWTSWAPHGTGSYPQFAGGQAAAFTRLNALAQSKGLVGPNQTVRDAWTSQIPPTDGQLGQLRDGLVLAAGCSGQTSANPPTYQSCTLPAGSTGFTAADWTAVVNETLREIYDARQVLSYFQQLDGIRSDAFLSNDAALPAIGSELLPLNGAAATPVSISPWAAGSAGIGIASAIAGIVNPFAGLALAAASYGVGLISSGTPALQAPPFFGTYADLQSKYATAVSQAIAALKTQTTEVLQNWGDMQLVTQLTAPGGPWNKLDSAGLVGSMQEGLSVWAYQTLLPTLYDRYAITGCATSNEGIGTTDCHFSPWGPVTQTNGSFTTLQAPPSGNWDSGASGGGGTPCWWHWWYHYIRCDYTSPPTSNGANGQALATQIWGPVSDTCNYTGDPLTAWKFGCNLGVQAQYSIDQAGDAYGWDFTTCTGNPVVSANGTGRGSGPPLQGSCSAPTGTANPGDDGAIQLAAATGAPRAFNVQSATFSAPGLLAPTGKRGQAARAGQATTATTIHLTLSHGKQLANGGKQLGTPRGAPPATLTLDHDHHGHPRLRFSVSRVRVATPPACQELPASVSLSTRPFTVMTSLTLSDGHHTKSIMLPATWRCMRNRAGAITAIRTLKPTAPAHRPGLRISVQGPRAVTPGSTVRFTVRLHNTRRRPHNRTISSLWNLTTTVYLMPARTHQRATKIHFRTVPIVRRARELRRGRSRKLQVAVRIPAALSRTHLRRVCITAATTADAAKPAFAQSCPTLAAPPTGLG